MKKVYLQENYTSLDNSVIGTADKASQSLGIYRFYRDGMPIEATSNGQIANRIVKLIVEAMKRAPELKTFHIYEFGAGIGILAWRILTNLQNRYPNLFEKTVLHLSDISERQVENIRKIPALSTFGPHLVFDVLDACSADFSAEEQPLIFYHTYLFDSIKNDFIHIKNGQLSVAKFKPWLPENALAFDFFEKKALFLNPAEIRSVIESGVDERIQNLWERLPELEYEVQLVPLEKCSELDNTSLSILREVAQKYPKAEGYFSFSQYHHQIIQNVGRHMHSQGFHLMIEIGSLDIDFNARIRTIWRMEGCQYYSQVNKSLLQMAANRSGQLVHTINSIYHRNYACFFTSGPNHWIESEPLHNFNNLWLPPKLTDIGDLSKSDDAYRFLLTDLTTSERIDSMSVQFELGYLHLMRGRDQEAIKHLKESLRLSLDTYILPMILLAPLMLRNGQPDLAWGYISAALERCQTFKMSWEILASMAEQVKDLEKLRHARERRLEASPIDEIDSSVADLIEACELQQDTQSAKQWKEFLTSDEYERFKKYWKTVPERPA